MVCKSAVYSTITLVTISKYLESLAKKDRMRNRCRLTLFDSKSPNGVKDTHSSSYITTMT